MAKIQYLIRRVTNTKPTGISTSTARLMLDYTLAVSQVREWRLAYPGDHIELLRRELPTWEEVEVE